MSCIKLLKELAAVFLSMIRFEIVKKVTWSACLFLFFMACPLAVSGETYYLSPSGEDTMDYDGSKTQPWVSLSFACKQVQNEGDTIYITPGTYTDNNICNLAVGVNITGAGRDKVVINSYIYNWYIRLWSSEYVNGNQQISGFMLNGGSSAADRQLKRAIQVVRRHNVSIHHMRFQNILNDDHAGAIGFYGTALSWDTNNTVPPVQWLDGCSFYECEVYNCSNCPGSDTSDGSNGAVRLIAVSNMKIYNNIFDESESPGECLKGVVGWLKGVKIYNNIFRVADDSLLRRYHLGIELWNLSDDCEIYNNTFYNGWCSFVSGRKMDGTYSLHFHHNKIYNARCNEMSLNDVLIEHNYFEGIKDGERGWGDGGIGLWQTWASTVDSIRNWTARYNVFSGSYGTAIFITDKSKPVTFEDVYIYNNTIDETVGHGITILGSEESYYNNFQIKNNIIMNYKWRNINNVAAAIENYEVSHNLFTQDKPELNYTGTRPSPYYLPAGADSNVVDAGIDVGLPFSGPAPDIGAYEYIQPEPSPLTNLAAAKTATNVGTPTVVQEDYIPEHAIDGSLDTRWAVKPKLSSMEVDLGAEYSISATEVVSFNSRGYQFTVSVSTDGESFTQVADESGSAEQDEVRSEFTAVRARYVRLNITGSNNYSNNYTGIVEFRIFGTEAGVLPGIE